MDPFQTKSHHFRTNKNPEIHISELPKSPNAENLSLFVGKAFFRKLFASKNDAERYRRNTLEPNCQKNTPYFNLRPPYFWKPLTCGYVAAGAFFLHRKGSHIFGSP